MEVAERLVAERDALARRVTDALYARHPDWTGRWGAAGREATVRDVAFHLDFLAAATAAGAPDVFARYAAWAASVLEARGVPTDALVETLDETGRAVVAALGPEGAVAAGIAASAASTLRSGGPREVAPVEGVDREDVAALVDALLSGDRRRAEAVLREALAAEHACDVADRVVRPAMYEVGRLWQTGRIDVATEHLATASLQSALARALDVGEPAGRTAVVACVEGNRHALGARLVAAALEAEGWTVRYLGADVPTRDLVQCVERTRPDVLALSLSLPQHVPVARRAAEAVRERMGRRAPRVVAGGLPFREFPGLAKDVRADEVASDVRGLLGAVAEAPAER